MKVKKKLSRLFSGQISYFPEYIRYSSDACQEQLEKRRKRHFFNLTKSWRWMAHDSDVESSHHPLLLEGEDQHQHEQLLRECLLVQRQ